MNEHKSTKAVLRKSEIFNDYNVVESNWELSILGHFLTSDCQCFGIDTYYAWVLDPRNGSSSGNLTGLDRNEPEKGICLSTVINDTEPPYLYLSPKNLLEILDAWREIEATKPQEVHLIMENGYVRVEVVK